MQGTSQKNRMSSQTFGFPKERKEPLNDARHVRDAIARFDQVEGVSDSERDAVGASAPPPGSTASK